MKSGGDVMGGIGGATDRDDKEGCGGFPWARQRLGGEAHTLADSGATGGPEGERVEDFIEANSVRRRQLVLDADGMGDPTQAGAARMQWQCQDGRCGRRNRTTQGQDRQRGGGG